MSNLQSYSRQDRGGEYGRYMSADASFIATEFCDAWVNNNGKFDEDWFSEGFRFVNPVVTYTGFAEFNRFFQEILPNFVEVDIAHEFHNDDYDQLLQKICPDIIATTSGDPKIHHKQRGAELVGAKVKTVCQRVDSYSTAMLVQKIKSN